MIGLPFQTLEDYRAKDLLFKKEMDIEMVGMGSYLEYENTILLYQYKDQLFSIEERFQLTLKMIAILRIIMKDVNIASSTALQAIDPKGREQGLRAGANVIMPNVTPLKYHQDYYLYNKPTVNEETSEYVESLIKNIHDADERKFKVKGDSKHKGKILVFIPNINRCINKGNVLFYSHSFKCIFSQIKESSAFSSSYVIKTRIFSMIHKKKHDIA